MSIKTKKDVPYKLEVCEYITEVIQSKPGKWIVLGDFNMAQFAQIGMVDVFRDRYPNEQKFTWWPYAYNARERDVGWKLDYIFVSECLKNKIKRIDILKNVLGSDHCPVLIEIDI